MFYTLHKVRFLLHCQQRWVFWSLLVTSFIWHSSVHRPTEACFTLSAVHFSAFFWYSVHLFPRPLGMTTTLSLSSSFLPLLLLKFEFTSNVIVGYFTRSVTIWFTTTVVLPVSAPPPPLQPPKCLLHYCLALDFSSCFVHPYHQLNKITADWYF